MAASEDEVSYDAAVALYTSIIDLPEVNQYDLADIDPTDDASALKTKFPSLIEYCN